MTNRRRTKALRAHASIGPGPDLKPGPGRAAMRASIQSNRHETLRRTLQQQIGRPARAYLQAAESTTSLLANRDRLASNRTGRLIATERKQRAKIAKLTAEINALAAAS